MERILLLICIFLYPVSDWFLPTPLDNVYQFWWTVADRDYGNHDLKLADILVVQTNSGIRENTLFYGVRSRLLWFTSTLYSYITDLIIDPNTKQMRVALGEGEDVDRMIDTHRGYMKRLIDQALLGSKLEPIHKTIITVLDLSIQLVDVRTMGMNAQTKNHRFEASIHDISTRKLLRTDPRVRQQGQGGMRYADSTEEDGSESETQANTILAADVDLSCTDRMKKIRSQFDGHCKFVATGLRGVARAGGEPNWDILADKLESGLGVTV
jgi:gamma-tubulin complex component 5